jgi:YD repeat-containing protein
MKKLFYLLSISMLLLQGCSSDSDSNDNNGSSTILCKSIRYNESNATNIRNHLIEYIYIGNKLSEIKRYYNDVLTEKSLVFYTGDLITEVKSYDELNRLVGNTVYKYNDSGQLIEIISYDGAILDFRYTYAHNQDGTITELTYDNYGLPQEELISKSTFTYTNGDLVKIDEIQYYGSQVYNNKIITYLYDDKNSPFKNVHSSLKKILIGLDFASPTGNNHNAIKMTETNSNPGYLSESSNYQYIYNSDNYPTTQSESNLNFSIVEYTY